MRAGLAGEAHAASAATARSEPTSPRAEGGRAGIVRGGASDAARFPCVGAEARGSPTDACHVTRPVRGAVRATPERMHDTGAAAADGTDSAGV